MKLQKNSPHSVLICCILTSFFLIFHHKALAFTAKNIIGIDTSKYVILRNDPGHIPKTFAAFSPLTMFSSSYGPPTGGVSLDVARDVIPRLKISANLCLAYPAGIIPLQYSTKFGSSKKINPWYNTEIRGTFFFINKILTSNQTIHVAPKSALYLTFPNVHRVAKLGVQAGYMQSNSIVSGKYIDSAGFKSGNFATNVSTGTLFVGLNYESILDLLANVYQYHLGKLEQRGRSKFYADLLLGTSHNVSDVVISGVSYNINNKLNYSNYGFRLGFNYDFIRPVHLYYSLEAGAMPGLTGSALPFKGAFFMIKIGIGSSFL